MENFDNGLEREQSGALEGDRRRSQGREGDLTELAAPRPIADHRKRRDSFEREEDKASQRRKSHASSATERDNELTEVAAPRPVETDSDAEDVTDDDEGTTPQQTEDKERVDSSEPQYSNLATEIYTLSWLTFFSFLGTLARLGVEAITVYPNAPWSSPVLWANMGGSFALGFLSEDRNLFRHEWTGSESTQNSFHPSKLEKDTASVHAKAGENHGKVKKTIPLYIGLATGFCGSFTSFSSLILDVFLALSNDLPLASSSPFRKSNTSVFHDSKATTNIPSKTTQPTSHPATVATASWPSSPSSSSKSPSPLPRSTPAHTSPFSPGT
jgi:fluoride ion exporter CrcB/FEX